MTAVAGAWIVEKAPENRRQLRFDIGNGRELLVQQLLAAFAIPLKAVLLRRPTHPFDHQAHGVSRAARRMRRVSWQHQHVACADRDVDDFTVLQRAQYDVALELVEEFIARVDMKIAAIIGAADDHDNEFAVAEQQLVAHWWLEQRAIRGDPRF